jgi:hypothetical protein
LICVQLNKLDTDGSALSGSTDAVVLQGSDFEELTRQLNIETRARQSDGSTVIDEKQIVLGGFLNATLGAKRTFDFAAMLGSASSLTVGGDQVGVTDSGFGAAADCLCGGAGNAFSLVRWHQAIACGGCVGLWVEVYPKITVRAVPVEDRHSRTNPLSQEAWQFSYFAPGSNFGFGPGDILPSTMPASSPRAMFIQSGDEAVSPVPLKFPGSTLVDAAGCFTCGTIPAGYLSSPHAVGGASNTGEVGGNDAYSGS